MPTIKQLNERDLRLWSLETDWGCYARRIAWSVCPPTTPIEAEAKQVEENMSRYLRARRQKPVYAIFDYREGK